MKWQNKLNKTELKHLRESGITTLKQAKINAEHQRDNKDFPCFECKRINHKLGLPL